MATAARGVKSPAMRAIPPAHMEKAERKQSHAGVFMAVAQVFKLLSLANHAG